MMCSLAASGGIDRRLVKAWVQSQLSFCPLDVRETDARELRMYIRECM